MRVVLVGDPNNPLPLSSSSLPLDARGSYIYGFDLSQLDLSRHDLTDVSVVSCKVDGLTLPGVPAPVGQTRNHNLYMRFNTGVASLTLPAYIPWDCHEMVAALFLQRLLGATDSARPFVQACGTWIAGAQYRQSWQSGWAMFSAIYGTAVVDSAVRLVCQGHPELLAHWAYAQSLPIDSNLTADRAERFRDVVTVDSAFVLSLGLTHPHDRWELARYLEAYLPQFIGIAPGSDPFRVHVWSLLPFLWTYALSADPDWWLGRFGG